MSRPRNAEDAVESLGLQSSNVNGVESARPKYEQLKSYLAEQVATGKLRPGDAIPSEQRLAEKLGIARSTVRQAMASLERDGLILRVHGKGTFIHDEARQRLRRGLDVFALVLPETQSGFYPSLQKSFEEAAGRFQNQILVCNSNNNVDRQGNIILQLLDKKIAGAAIVPTTTTPTPPYQIRQLQTAGIPVVYCHRPVDGVQAPLVAIPFHEVGLLAGKSLAERGHRRVAFFSPHRTKASAAYEGGCREALLKAGGDLPSELTYYGPENSIHVNYDEEAIEAALERMLRDSQPPTAIFATFDSLAETIYLMLGRMGVRVPQDISLLGFGGVTRIGAIVRRLSSVTVDETQIGRLAAEMLHRMRNGVVPIDDGGVQSASIQLAIGTTLGPAPIAPSSDS